MSPPTKRASAKQPTPFKDSGLLLAGGYLLSIILALGMRFGLPGLWASIPNPLLGFLVIVLLVPASPALAMILQGRAKASVSNLLVLYLEELTDLLFKLLFLLLILPLVFLSVINVAVLIVLCALAIGFILFFVQEVVGIPMGMSVTWHDMLLYLAVFAALSLAEVILILAKRGAERREEGLSSSLIKWQARVSSRIKSHRQA